MEQQKTVYVKKFTAWAPGFLTCDDWADWVNGKKNIEETGQMPDILFTDPLFRRRLSQLSKMTIQVIHDILPISENSKLIFLSFYGEIAQQMKINKMLIEQNSVMPAAFSLSVFNAPVALATIALNLTAGYTAIYTARNQFFTGFLAAAASVLNKDREERVFIYADELVPHLYGKLCPVPNRALAFAAIISSEKNEKAIPVPLNGNAAETIMETPDSFLKYLFQQKEQYCAE